MPSTYTYDPGALTSPLAPVYALRRVIGDTDVSGMAAGLPQAQQTALFSDQELFAFLADNNADIIFAAYDALMALAARYSVMAVRVNLGSGAVGDIDYSAVADKLRAQAEQMREKYIQTPAWAYSEESWNDFSLRRIFFNDILRGP